MSDLFSIRERGITTMDEPQLRKLAAQRPADGQAQVYFASAILQMFDLLTANKLKGVSPDRVRVVLTDG